jgi:hypothetical protein
MKCLYKVRLPFPSPASARREHCTAGSLLHARALVTVDLRCLAACSRTPCAGCPQTGPLVLSRTTFAAPPPPHEAEHHRPQQRALADVHRYRDFAANLCRIGRSPTERQLHHSAHQSLPPSKASSARAPRPLALAGARCHHILAPPSLQPHAPRLHSTPSPPATRSPASACTRLQIAGSATVILCSPASSQATLAPLLLQFSLRAILVCVSTHPRRHPHTLHLASLCSPFIHIPDPHPLPPTFHA